MGKHLLLAVILVSLSPCLLVCADAPASLLEALKDKDASVRLQAAQLLAQMGEGKAALPVLVELLRTPQKAVRLDAAQLLKQMGPAQLKAAVPALVALLKDPDANVRLETAQILGTAGSAARAAAPALVATLN